MIGAKLVVMKALGWLRAVPWQAWAILALCVAVWTYGAWRYTQGARAVQTRWDAAEALHAAAAAVRAEEVRIIEARWQADYTAAIGRLLKEQDDANKTHAAVVAGLRAGTERLRQRFRCPSGALPAAPGTPGGRDGADGAGFTVADAEVALGIARDGDTAIRRLKACQDILRAR